MRRFATVGGVTGIGFLALGLGLPKVIEGLPPAVSYGLSAIGAVLLLTAFVWWLINRGTDARSVNTTHGAGSHIFAGPVHNPTFSSAPKFSAIAELTTLPPHMGGQWVMDLDGLATLRLRAPYSENSATLALDMVPLKHPDVISEGMEMRGIWIHGGEMKEYFFDTDRNKRHTMEAGGKVFVITLREIEAMNVEGVAKPLKFTFSAKEA